MARAPSQAADPGAPALDGAGAGLGPSSVPALVARRAAAGPAAMAAVGWDRALSYGELNRRANQVARHLLALGAGPDTLVACCLERSLDLVVALLGVLKAGAAYVPLDPSYPPDRLAFMLADCRAPVLVTRRPLLGRLPDPSARVVCLDADAAALDRLAGHDVDAAVRPGHLAYVIYTSGSTGRPKGVEVTHGGLLNLVRWHHRAFAVTPADRATQVTSPAFDATGWELWPYLTAGASVHLPDEDTRATPVSLRAWLLRHRVTVSFLPTPLAESLMALPWPPDARLRLLLTGADTLHRHPPPGLPFALVNNYGPTEATVVATSGRIPAAERATSPPSIGRPIASTVVRILDEDLRPLPDGVPGELCIGGAGLARGYLRRPGLTAERFVPDPLGEGPGDRLYRTGDLVRLLPDGEIAFLGRTDHQVKIRGYRVEPDEIAAVIGAHPDVAASVVVGQGQDSADRRLVAYVVFAPGARLGTAALRDLVAGRLPDFMVPAAFVVLEALPLTPNGKIDRAALPPAGPANTLRDTAMVEAATHVEETLSGLVAPLLALDRVGVEDNFFLLGGSSMMGTQLISRVAETFGVDIPLRTLFEAPTVRLLAAEIERLVIARIESMSEDEVLRLLQEPS